MKITAQIRWTLDSVEIEPRLVTLLESIARNGNLQAAAKSAGLSYRHAWGLLEAAGTELGEQLVNRQQGRGTQLAPLGTKLLEGMVDVNGSLAAGLREGEARMAAHLAQAPASARNPAQVTLFASHDLALAQMREIFAKRSDLKLSLQFHGSLDCLAAMRRNQCELAGFHLPSIPGTRTLAAQFIPFLSLKGWRVTRRPLRGDSNARYILLLPSSQKYFAGNGSRCRTAATPLPQHSTTVVTQPLRVALNEKIYLTPA
jgi:molybdate transport repressor ModE-like protein